MQKESVDQYEALSSLGPFVPAMRNYHLPTMFFITYLQIIDQKAVASSLAVGLCKPGNQMNGSFTHAIWFPTFTKKIRSFANYPSLLSSESRGGGRKMEGNRDEAEKCINIATKALEAGDKDKAVKFLNKAEKLYPTYKAKALLDTLTRNGSSAGNGAHCRQRTTDSSSESTKARAGGQDQEAGGGEPSTKGFTKDQVEGVQRIKRCKGY
eukprot:XP_014050316.1 PREDICTED: dnaJ homolog subfamily B member 14 isoform X1 [Salmo salar]